MMKSPYNVFSEDSFAPPRDGQVVLPLVDGNAFFGALEKELDGAKELWIALSFAKELFTFPGGRFGNTWLSFLKTVGETGCNVRVLAWDDMPNPIFSGTFNSRSNLKRLEEMAPRNVSVRWTESYPDAQHCHHEKSFLVSDASGKVTALTGGIIPSPNWCTSPSHETGAHMHDVGVLLRGESAHDLAVSFVQRWNAAVGPRYHGEEALTVPPQSLSRVENGEARVQITRSIRPGLVPEAPEGEASILTAWLKAIDAAQHFIYVEQQHTAHEECMAHLCAALDRGVQVIFVRPPSLHSIQPTDRNVDEFKGRTRAMYERVFLEWMPKFEAKGGVLCGLFQPLLKRRIHVHSKVLIVDDEVLLVGSANLVDISFDLKSDLHTEVCAVIHHSPSAKELRAQLFAEHSGVQGCAWDQFLAVAKRNAARNSCGRSEPDQGLVFQMSPTAWGIHILEVAVSIYERARPGK